MIDALKKYNFWDKNVKGTGIKRQAYLYRLDRLNTGRPVVTVTGLRRAGKSFIIRQFIDFLIRYKKVSPCQIFYANLFLRELNFLKNPNMFQEAVALWKSSQKVDTNKRMYIFIDEVQEINEWQKLVSSYYEDYTAEYKIFITGSNSKLLSGELGTYLAGRSHELVVYPLSFEEYLLFVQKEKTREVFLEYLSNGGMPEIILTDNEFAENNLIETTIDSVIMRDIVSRYKIRNIRLLRKVVDFISFSATDEISKNRMAGLIKESGSGVSVHTISDYIEFLKQAYFIHECPVFSYKKNDLLKSGPRKIYLNDLVFSKKGQSFGGFGKQLENLVYIELKRRGYKISTFKTDSKEVDFFCEKKDEKVYYQVAWTIGDPDSETYRREYESLLTIKNHYPKYIISMDEMTLPSNMGIQHIQAVNFF